MAKKPSSIYEPLTEALYRKWTPYKNEGFAFLSAEKQKNKIYWLSSLEFNINLDTESIILGHKRDFRNFIKEVQVQQSVSECEENYKYCGTVGGIPEM